MFTKPRPAEVLAFYREFTVNTGHFTRDSDQTADGITTLKWHGGDSDMILVVGVDVSSVDVHAAVLPWCYER